jgi:hypothetical protein
MDLPLLIPTQETEVAYRLLDYADNIMEDGFSMAKKVAKQIANAKYWEAYNCKDSSRQEYWRQVMICFDTISQFRATE